MYATNLQQVSSSTWLIPVFGIFVAGFTVKNVQYFFETDIKLIVYEA